MKNNSFKFKVLSFKFIEWVFLAFQFLTIIPIRMKTERNISEKDIARSSMFFPVAGAFQGLVITLSAFILNIFFSSSVTSGMIILVYVLLNGGFHLDGLSDTCDALSVKSTGNANYDKERRLAVMKDSSTGAIGATAICLAILLKYIFVKELFLSGRQFNPYFVLFLVPVFSKWVMVLTMRLGKSAKPDGLGKIFLKQGTCSYFLVATLLTLFLTFLFFSLFVLLTSQLVNTSFGSHIWALSIFCVVEMIILFFICHLLSRWFVSKFGGLTGDNFGAIHEVSEFIFLMVALLWK
ncbi:MAG: adenosylcobinamide-GDP ribazoletransferase [Proteobacteria bacterium]|nr:adenosylcobinamide-GDP ribazoletransferase [Pseudomonadota bacterium]